MVFITKSGSAYTVDPVKKVVCGKGTNGQDLAFDSIIAEPLVGNRFACEFTAPDGRKLVFRTSEVTWAHA